MLITVDKRSAAVFHADLLTSGSAGIAVQFRFSEEWEGLGKIAVFKGSGVSVDVVLTGTTCVIPAETLAKSGQRLLIGVYGTDGAGAVIIPTVWASAGIIHPGAAPGGTAPIEPTPTVVDQILAAAAEAVEIARSVRDDADSGAFDGAAGPQGEQGPRGETGPQGEQGPPAELDTSLTQAGRAADAKAAGDAIAEAKSAAPSPVIDTVSGNPAVFSGAEDKAIQELILTVKGVQSGSGIASFENPRSFVGFTGCGIYHEAEYDASADPKIEFDWTDSAGTIYGFTLNVKTGVLTKTHYLLDLSNYTYYPQSTSGAINARFGHNQESIANTPEEERQSNCLRCYKNNYSFPNRDLYTFTYVRQNYYPCEIKLPSTYDTSAKIKALFSDVDGNGTHGYLLTRCSPPVTYQLTPSELTALLGNNAIWSEYGTIDVSYAESTKSYVDKSMRLTKALLAPVLDSMTADTALGVNDFRIVGDTLYRITANVASGGTLTEGTNCAATTIGEMLTALLNA